jgi:hypothetical protein
MLDIVDLGELPAVVWRDILLEFHLGLAAEIVPVNEEKYPFRPAITYQPVDETHGSKGLTGTGCHLDKCPWMIIGKGSFEIGYGLVLTITQTGSDKRGQMPKPGPEGILLMDPFMKGLGFMESKNTP